MLAKKTLKSQIPLPRAIVRQIPLRRTISTAHSKGGTVLRVPRHRERADHSIVNTKITPS